ncbi:hypothetical protein B4N89_38325 [Embleya scabrispora]|uniref:FAD dependent oxidoreductase domain-containing protein n=1 Tax=Embleya scabrispora TaxID=159449 RepID=A0A1T3NMV5_9ACTN|nr:FAD-dependent oxidoreductase [Embleya scabrispora]OPC78068.1 hypothetical protein B4N89_38325 [Embleya scabrispora]
MASLIICGAGVVGLTTALLLTRDGHEVTVYEGDPSVDRARATAMNPDRTTEPPSTPDPFGGAAFHDGDLFRALLETATCLALPHPAPSRPPAPHPRPPTPAARRLTPAGSTSPHRSLDHDVREPLLNAIAERVRTRMGDRAPRHYPSVLRAGRRTERYTGR